MGFQGTTQKESPGTQVAKPGLELSALAIVSGVASALQSGQRERNMLLAACWWSSQLTREIHELEASVANELRLGSPYGAG